MNNTNRCYERLGLRPGASLEEVKQAYRDLAMVWHPDRFPNNPRLKEKAQEELKKINEAYEVLKSYQFSSSTPGYTPKTKPSNSADAKICYEQGMEKAKRGRYREAVEDFSHARQIHPKYAEVYEYRGLAYFKLEDKKRAIQDFQKAAYLYREQGKTDKSQDLLERIKKLQIPE
jgi:tetratricopeptide (TPR) repeat protein